MQPERDEMGEMPVAVSGSVVVELRREVDELRTRTNELEALAGATRSLARSTQLDEARRTLCDAAIAVAGCELAAVIEPTANGAGLLVTAACGGELGGVAAHADPSAYATSALSTGTVTFASNLDSREPALGWPLAEAGAVTAVWQPIRPDGGRNRVIAMGWTNPTARPSDRLLGLLELLADEAAVAIDRAEALEHMTGLARTDPLTEVSNRRAWQDELSRELARATRVGHRLSIGLLDLDDLKSFNDRWGHAAGDRLLHTAAVRWRRRLRVTDLLARIGGDEFAITLPACTLAEAVTLGDQLRGALPDGLSCSVGVAEWVGGEPVESLLKRADEGLYAAKHGGRDRTIALSSPVSAD
jgi:diguanylate cyclase (GGDEF)-like protein